MQQRLPDIVILCGGLGTRLQSVVWDRPKPMAVVQDRPFLDWVVDHVLSQGFTRIIFATGHLGEWINRYYEGRGDFTAVMAHENAPRGTAGALRACRPLIETDRIVVLNGDSLCRIDVHGLLAAHAVRGGCATLAAVPAGNRIDGGNLIIDSRDRVIGFEEKQLGPVMNAGVYVLASSLIDTIPDSVPCSLEREVFPRLCGNGLFAFVVNMPVYDIGTPDRLAEVDAMICRAGDGQPSPVL
jgi:NDP-sugar pyrophosphorylase family protein